jgi:hypothetical protein
MDSLK